MTEEIQNTKLDRILEKLFGLSIIIATIGVITIAINGGYYYFAYFYWPWVVSEFQFHQSIALSRAIAFLGFNLIGLGVLLFILVIIGLLFGEKLGLITVHPIEESQKED